MVLGGPATTVVASYDYLGSGQVVKTYLDEAEVYSSVTGASGHGYADLDRFGRLIASSWTWDEATDVNLYRTAVSYDRNSWITRVEDTTWTRQSVDYTNDELGRLTLANRGLLSGGSITVNNFNHEWTLGQTGNWNRSKLDLNGDADLTDTDELDENNPLASGGSAHFNAANELTARDTDNNGSDNYTLAYDEVGNMTDDGREYEYVYDPFGRLRKVKNTSSGSLVAEYWYNGLGHRVVWHSDTSRSGGGAPDGTVDTNDPKVHLIYNERWQVVAVYRQANGSNVDTYPKEQFVSHAAGFGEFGGSSYIDGVILRDDHEDDWTEAADSTMERRVYYCQNWRADVVALVAENGRVLERAWYEPYGTPHGMSPADLSGTSDDTNDHYLVPDGDADADDSFVYLDLFGLSAGLSDTTGSSDPGDPEYGRPNGVVDSDDYFYYLDVFSSAAALGRNVLSAGHDGATASHGAGNLRNRRGLAGYEWDPHVRRYHVRNRVLYPEIGRWSRRDPLGYVDGASLIEYGQSLPIISSDAYGLDSCLQCDGMRGVITEPGDSGPAYPKPIGDPSGSFLACLEWADYVTSRLWGMSYDCASTIRPVLVTCCQSHNNAERYQCLEDIREDPTFALCFAGQFPPLAGVRVCCRKVFGGRSSSRGSGSCGSSGSILNHCYVTTLPCLPGESAYGVYRRSEGSLPNGTPCSLATEAQISACISAFPPGWKSNPNGPYMPWNNCLTKVTRQMRDCCAIANVDMWFLHANPRRTFDRPNA